MLTTLLLLLLAGAQEAPPPPPPEGDEPGLQPELVLMRGQPKGVWLARVSADGATLVTLPISSSDKLQPEAVVWDVATHREIGQLGYQVSDPTLLELSSDGLLAVIANRQGTLLVSELRGSAQWTWEELGVLVHAAVHDGVVTAVTSDGVVRRLRLEDRSEVDRMEVGVAEGELGGDLAGSALSADGRRLVYQTGGDVVRVCDLERGGVAHELQFADVDYRLRVAPDSSWIAAAGSSGRVRLWRDGGAAPPEDLDLPWDARAARFSADAGVLISRGEHYGTTEIWSVGERRLLGAVPGEPLELDREGEILFSGKERGARAFAVADRAPRGSFEGLLDPLAAVAISPDGRRMVTGDTAGTAYLWDLAEGMEVGRLEVGMSITTLGFLPDGERVVISSQGLTMDQPGSKTQVWDLAAGEVVAERTGRASAVLQDGGRIAVVEGSGPETAREQVLLWDADTGAVEVLRTFGSMDYVSSLAVSGDGSRLGVVLAPEETLIWDVATRELVFTGPSEEGAALNYALRFDRRGERFSVMNGEGVVVRSVEGGEVLFWSPCAYGGLTPDGSRLFTQGAQMLVELLSVDSGESLAGFPGAMDVGSDFAVSPDGRFLFLASQDGTVAVYDLETLEFLVHATSFTDGTWAVLELLGRFDAANGGLVDGLYWKVGEDILELAQLKDAYYDPELLAKKLGLSDEPEREVASLDLAVLSLAPEVEVTKEPGAADRTLRARLVNRGGGIGPVAIMVNGREFLADARPDGVDEDAAELSIEVDLGGCRFFDAALENTVEVVPSNRSRELTGRGGRIRVARSARAATPDPTFHAVVVGVSNYAGSAIDLRFAAKDAEAFADAIELGAKGLLGEANVRVARLYDGATPPTRANVVAALEELKRAQTSDVLLLFLAGHGVSYNGEYYYLLSNANTLQITNAALAREFAITGAELTEWMRSLAALKVVMILDTCSSAQVIEGMSRGDSSSRARAVERMKDRSGVFILSGSAADAPSYESTPYGHGLLTYSLLAAMRGGSLREGRFVDVNLLFDFARDEVPRLAKDLKGIQRPHIAVPNGGAFDTFDLGELDAAARASIRLAEKRPTVLRARLERKDQPVDDLGLTDLVNEALRAHSAGDDPRFVFVDSGSVAAAFRVAGRYSVDGDAVTADLFVYRGTELLGTKQVAGRMGELESMVDAVLRELVRVLAAAGS